MRADKPFEKYRYCKYSETESADGCVNTWNEELLSAIVILLRSHHILREKDPLCFDPDILEELLRAEEVIDEEQMFDPAGIEKVYPVRFRRKVPFEQRYIEELVCSDGLCVLEVSDARDGSIHFFACSGIDGDDVLITDHADRPGKLDQQGKCRSILWFDNLDRTEQNAPKDAVAVVSKAVSFLGTEDKPLHSNNVIFNYDFRDGEPIKEDDWWCTAFVWDVFRMCGLSHLLCNGQKFQDAIDILEWGRQSGRMVGLTDIRYGDILIFNWDGTGSADHSAICINVRPDNRMLTIDACTRELDDKIGGHVNFRCRVIEEEEILGVIRPEYK